MSEVIDNLARDCARGRGGILSITPIPCDGIKFTILENNITVVTQTKVAKTITLDINSGKAMSTQEGERATFNSIYKEQVEFTVKNDELLTDRVIASLTGGLHIYAVSYANGKNKVFGAGGHEDSVGDIIPVGMFANAVSDSGTEGTDLNGTVVTATSESGTIPPHLSNVLLQAIKDFTV